jgi:hypothetical protein
MYSYSGNAKSLIESFLDGDPYQAINKLRGKARFFTMAKLQYDQLIKTLNGQAPQCAQAFTAATTPMLKDFEGTLDFDGFREKIRSIIV